MFAFVELVTFCYNHLQNAKIKFTAQLHYDAHAAKSKSRLMEWTFLCSCGIEGISFVCHCFLGGKDDIDKTFRYTREKIG